MTVTGHAPALAEDWYPSRIGGQGGVMPRRDPVVYGGRPEQLNESQWSGYERDGYLFLADFLAPPQIRVLCAELQRLREEMADSDSPEVVREPRGREVRSIFAVHRISKAVEQLVRNPQLLAIVEAVLGGPVYVHQSRINFKPGFEGKEFFWHSDFETWHVEDGMPRMRALSCSINLTENTPYNGPLMVVPGSHQKYLACPGRTPEDHYKQSLVRQEYGTPPRDELRALIEERGIAAPLGGPGSMLVFDSNTMHGSNSNISPQPRSNVFIVFNSVHNRLVDPFCGLAARPEHIASRESLPVVEPLAQ